MTPKNEKTTADPTPDGVASAADNAKLEHTAGGVTTRDSMDAGVPMLPGDPREPVGPEDAFGPGAKRGDYSDRITSGPSLITETIPESERVAQAQKIADGSDGALTVGQALGDVPRTRLVDQASRATERGDEPGKGGVPGSVPRDIPVPTS
jgi:hypothetical protein